MKIDRITPLLKKLTYHPASLEAIAAEMILLEYLDLREMELHAKSTFARAYSRDIRNATIEERSDERILRLETNREGIYDQLPQGFFHRPAPSKPKDKAKQRIEKLKVTRKQEAEARRFFLPFEQEGFYFMTKAEISERQLTNPFNSKLRHNLLVDIWPSCRDLPESYYPILCYILPLSYRIAGDPQLMGACYAAITKYPVRVAYVDPGLFEPEKEFRDLDIRSDMTLGVDMITSGEPAAELPVMRITIGPMDRSATAGFLENGEQRKVMDVLSDALVPLDVTVRYEFEYLPGDDFLEFESPYSEPSYLGYNTTLTT